MTKNIEVQTTRQMKALAIAGLDNQIKRIDGFTYKVKSQTVDSWYDVVFQRRHGWTCSCPDHTFRNVECKHITAVYISKELRHKIVNNTDVKEIESQSELICRCKSMNVIKIGVRHNKSGEIQRYKCKDCSQKWSDNLGFAKNKVNSRIITVALDLYFKGVSLRKVSEHLILFHGVKVSNVAVLGWVRKFGEVVAPFVDQLVPKNVSGVYHVDEMMIHVRNETMERGHYQWLWNVMDNTTRFWITSKVSQRREAVDARAVFQDVKRKAPLPNAIVHDGLQSYNEAYNKEFYFHANGQPTIKNVRSVSVRHRGLNQKVERLNGIMRDRESVMRGMQNRKSAQKTIDAYRIHYNFIREHGSIKKTPAEEAGIKLDLGQNKIENLIKLASKKTITL
ncbi:MAG: IS1/IS6 family transposase [Thaumarchaeota archaeon]|nr:IS1/IS6 family transposase [Nitrososphaerota archaeon]